MYLNMLCYRLSHYPGSRWRHLSLGSSTLADEVVHDLTTIAPEFYRVEKECGQFVLHFDFYKSDKLSLKELTSELRRDAINQGVNQARVSDFELLAAVMAKGVVHGTYGNTYWGSEAETVHLLVCGIDWSQYRGVDSEFWAEFGGTFAESDNYTDVLGTHLHCRCAEDVEVQFGIEPPSLAQMIKSLGAGSLEKIFEI